MSDSRFSSRPPIRWAGSLLTAECDLTADGAILGPFPTTPLKSDTMIHLVTSLSHTCFAEVHG
jgi:hypothetical protein